VIAPAVPSDEPTGLGYVRLPPRVKGSRVMPLETRLRLRSSHSRAPARLLGARKGIWMGP
jgi:hypothetical protein